MGGVPITAGAPQQTFGGEQGSIDEAARAKITEQAREWVDANPEEN